MRAARCALDLRALVPDLPIAIATGRSEVSAARPTGEAIERAAELLAGRVELAEIAAREGLPRPPIAIDDVTAALLELGFDVGGEAGARSLVRLRAAPASGRVILGRVTPMVGRSVELGAVTALFRECVEEPFARPILVTGAAGMGKSRFASEVVRALSADLPALEVWWGRSDPRGAGSALGLLGQVVRAAAFGEAEPIAVDEARRALAALVARSVPAADAAWVTEALGEIAGAPPGDEASPAHRAAREDPRSMIERTSAAWEALVAGTAARGPLLVVLEDLHWADAPSVRIVGAALHHLERRSWQVLALARPEVHDRLPGLWAGRNLQEIRLTALNRRAAARLARDVLGDDVDAATIERCVERAGGNAFYLEELIRAAAGGRGAAAPEAALAMVQERIEALDPETRRVLRAASVFGEVFWPGGVEALLAEAPPPSGWVAELDAREIVSARGESRFAGEPDLAFRHALLREGVYATLTGADRTRGHALAAAWLALHAEADPIELSRHVALGGRPSR